MQNKIQTFRIVASPIENRIMQSANRDRQSRTLSRIAIQFFLGLGNKALGWQGFDFCAERFPSTV
jgi:hypothetical protein